MHILIDTISRTVMDRANIAIANKHKAAYGFSLVYLHLTWAHSKVQGHADIACEYLANGDR